MSMWHKSMLTLLRRSHARLFILVAVVLTCGSLTQALANGKARDHNSHIGRGWMAERDFGHGWGWDASVGFYEGPFWVCFNPDYGWHPCPFDGVLAERPRVWGGLWHRRS